MRNFMSEAHEAARKCLGSEFYPGLSYGELFARQLSRIQSEYQRQLRIEAQHAAKTDVDHLRSSILTLETKDKQTPQDRQKIAEMRREFLAMAAE